MPKQCKHEFTYDLHQCRLQKAGDIIAILSYTTLITTCIICEKQSSDMVAGGVVCENGFTKVGEELVQKLFRLRKAKRQAIRRDKDML